MARRKARNVVARYRNVVQRCCEREERLIVAKGSQAAETATYTRRNGEEEREDRIYKQKVKEKCRVLAIEKKKIKKKERKGQRETIERQREGNKNVLLQHTRGRQHYR